MKGYINDSLVPKIRDIFLVGKSELIPIEPVLDTGFNDEFTLPRLLFDRCKLEYFGKEEYILADGRTVEENVFIGELIIDNKRKSVFISITDDNEALIGTRLLDKKIIILNFKDYSISIEDE